MDRWNGKVAVVTGASSGIGADISCRLVEYGLQVVGFARRVEKVEELSKRLQGKSGKLHSVKCDVRNKDEVIKSFKWVADNLGPVHILINNAGLYINGSIMEGNPDDWKTVLETNVFGVTVCSQQAMQQMREHHIAGHIIHINSIAGVQPRAGRPPILNVYSPSKYAVSCLTDVMRQECASFNVNIKVTSICPGVVKTDIFETAGSNFTADMIPHLKTKDVSDAVIYALSTGPNVQVYELQIAHLFSNMPRNYRSNPPLVPNFRIKPILHSNL